MEARALARAGEFGEIKFFSRRREGSDAIRGVGLGRFDEAAVSDDLNHPAGFFRARQLFVVHVTADIAEGAGRGMGCDDRRFG